MLQIAPIEYLDNADFDWQYRAFGLAENFASHLNSSTQLSDYVDFLIDEFKVGDDRNPEKNNRAVLFKSMVLAMDFVVEHAPRYGIESSFRCFRETARIMEAFSDMPLLGGQGEGIQFVSAVLEMGNSLYEFIDSENQARVGADFIKAINHISATFEFKGEFSAVDRRGEDYKVLEELRMQLSYFIEPIVMSCVHDSTIYQNHQHQLVGLRILDGVVEAAANARLLDFEEPFQDLIVRIESCMYASEEILDGDEFGGALAKVYDSLLRWVRLVGTQKDMLGGFFSASLDQHIASWGGWMPTLSTLLTLSPNYEKLVQERLLNIVIFPLLDGEQSLIVPFIQFMRDGRDQLGVTSDVLRRLGKGSTQEICQILSPYLHHDSLMDHLRELASVPLEAL